MKAWNSGRVSTRSSLFWFSEECASCVLDAALVDSKTRCTISLLIAIDDEDADSVQSEMSCDIDDSGRLSDTAFLIHDGDDTRAIGRGRGPSWKFNFHTRFGGTQWIGVRAFDLFLGEFDYQGRSYRFGQHIFLIHDASRFFRLSLRS